MIMEFASITFVTPWYGRFAGGAEVAARSFAEQLVRRGLPVQILTTCCRSPFESWWRDTLPPGVEDMNGVRVHRFPVNATGEGLYQEVMDRIVHGLDVDDRQQRQIVYNSINSDALVEYARTSTAGHLVIGM